MRMHALHPKWLRLSGGPGMPTADLWALCACPSCCISAEVNDQLNVHRPSACWHS